MVHLYIIRHGETEENAAGILQGHMPGRLTEKGRGQAVALRRQLVAAGAKPDALVCSDLARAVETARIVNEAYALPLTPTPLLRERDWGELTGARIADVAGTKRFPASVESVEDMGRRARRLLTLLLTQYDGQRVLCVGHGLFNRCLLAAAASCTLHDIPRMANGEVREVDIDRLPPQAETPTTATGDRADDKVSAD